MYFKVKITKRLPNAKTGGFTGNNLNKQVISFGGADMNAASRHLENTRYLKEVPRDEANLEAEKGESAFGDINGDGFTEHMLIGGKRHHSGGTPLNLPDGTFIFSDTASMKLTDCSILKMFNKACGKKGYTPAELAKPYDINKYRKILEDPNSDKVDKKSAELMIKNINLKLGALALAQEAKKGFPQGIPEVAKPYMEAMKISEEDLIPQKGQSEAQVDDQAMQNPYENQGMGEQSPEEEMMEQGQGMQNPEEEMMEEPPMAQYGMATGAYNPYQNFNPNQQLSSENDSDNSQSTGRGGFFSNLFGGNNKRRIKNKKNKTTIINNYGAPQPGGGYNQPQAPQNNYNNYTNYSAPTAPMANNTYSPQTEEHQDNWNTVRHVEPASTSIPGAGPRYSEGTFGANGYTPPAGYRNGGALNRFVGGGSTYDIPKDAVVIDRSKYKTDEEYTTGRNEEFAKAGKKPVYIKMPDGKYKKLTQKTKAQDPYTGDDLGTTWNNSEIVASQFRDMDKSINTPEFTKVLSQYTRAALKNEAKYKGKSGKTSKAYADLSKKDFKDEEIKDAFALHQKRNLALQAHGIQARYFEDAPSGKLLTPQQMVAKKVINDDGEPVTLEEAKQMYNTYKGSNITDLGKAFTKVGIPLSNTALEQATFQGFTDALMNKGSLTKEEQAELANWEGYETGAEDESGQENARISPIDQVYTNTTGEQVSRYNKPLENEFVETDVEGNPVEQQAATEEEMPEAPYESNPEWWKQDKVNMGLAARDYFAAERGIPWAPDYIPEYLKGNFKDVTRANAGIAEQANIENNALAQFMGPQQFSARQSGLSGQKARAIADINSQYDTDNVTIANNLAGTNVGIANDARKYNQQLHKGLYDANEYGRANLAAEKTALLHNAGNAFNTGTTNMMQTDAMNQMYPQYAVDPGSGGRMHFTKGKSGLNPTMSQDSLEYAQKISNSGLPEKVQQSLIDSYIERNQGADREGMPNMYARSKKGGSVKLGYVMGSNVFPFQFT